MPKAKLHSVKNETKARILIVDDSRIIRVALKKILQKEYQTDEAEDGLKALDKITENEYELIITDLEMPNLNGFALIEKIRNSEETFIKHLPILVISGDEIDRSNTDALKQGATDYLLKPFQSDEVLKTIGALLRLSAQHQSQYKADDEAHKSGYIDPLTGLGNNAFFTMRGDQELAFAKRHEKDLSVAMIHFDGFAIHQNHLGKKRADQLLKQAAIFIKNSARSEETVARIREDRFAVILTMANMFGAKTMVDRLMKRVHETRFKVAGRIISFTMTICISTPSVNKVAKFNDIIINAEETLDQAILTGGDKVVQAEEGSYLNTSIQTEDEVMNLSINHLMNLVEEKDERIEAFLPTILEKIIPLIDYSTSAKNKDTQASVKKLKLIVNKK